MCSLSRGSKKMIMIQIGAQSARVARVLCCHAVCCHAACRNVHALEPCLRYGSGAGPTAAWCAGVGYKADQIANDTTSQTCRM